VLPEGYPGQVRHSGKYYWILPSLEKARQQFDLVTSFQTTWLREEGVELADVPF